MAQPKRDKLSAGSRLDALVAERVFGWKNIHRKAPHADGYRRQKPDKLGGFRLAKVLSYSTDTRLVSQIEEPMIKLKLFDRFQTEVSMMARAEDLPADYASPEQPLPRGVKEHSEPNTTKGGEEIELHDRLRHP